VRISQGGPSRSRQNVPKPYDGAQTSNFQCSNLRRHNDSEEHKLSVANASDFANVKFVPVNAIAVSKNRAALKMRARIMYNIVHEHGALSGFKSWVDTHHANGVEDSLGSLYRSEDIGRDLVQVMSDVLQARVLRLMQSSPLWAMFGDESTDASNTSQLDGRQQHPHQSNKSNTSLSNGNSSSHNNNNQNPRNRRRRPTKNRSPVC
jgi:hypothetical protein